MNTVRYECIAYTDSLSVFEETNVYNAEQIDDTCPIINNIDDNFKHIFTDDLTWRGIFHDSHHTQRQQRLCIGMIIAMICVMCILLISLFLGFSKVIFGIAAFQERSRHGLMMVPNVQKQLLNVFYFNLKNKTANAEYVKEIDDYLSKYIRDQEMMNEFLKICSAQQRGDKNHWCTFDMRRQFRSGCSKETNYGYDSGNPCILFVFDNRLGWKPNMRSEMNYLPFFCRMKYQFSSNIYTNITYYPPLSTTAAIRNGGFQMNLTPNQRIVDENGREIFGEDGNMLYTLPPLIMAKMSLLNVLRSASDTNDSDLGPFTMDCRLRNNLDGYQFDNINQFNGRTAISFDFVPKFS